MNIVDKLHQINALPPVADAFSGTATSDVVNALGEGVLFTLYKGVGTTGTSTVTVLACDDTTPSNTTAVEFIYRSTAASGTDVFSDWTAATTAGFTTTAGSNHLYEIYVDAAQLAEEGYGYDQLQAVEVVDDPVLGGIMANVTNVRYGAVDSSLID